MKKLIIAIFILMVFCNRNEEEKPQKVASLGKDVIYREDFENHLKSNLGEDPYRHTPEVLSELLDNLIKEKLLYNYALKENIEGETQYEIINNLIENLCSKLEKPSEEYLKEWYDAHKEKFKTSNEYYFWQIFITKKEEAERVYKLAREEKDFQKLLQEYSETINKEKGGLLGPLSLEDIPEEIALSLSKLKKGEISQLLPVSGGFMILKLKDIFPSKQLSFEEAKGMILQYLKEEMCQKAIEDFQKSLILKETIWVYQKNLLFSYCGQFPVYQP